MNALYNTNDRFLEASKKFPRFLSIRRRPVNSIGGKLLQSIIEEIGAVEDAIIDYKKDFFIVNYLDRPNEFVDYLYYARIGEIEDFKNFSLKAPALEVTKDKDAFYDTLESLAYYQDGRLFFYSDPETVEYTYNGFIYKKDTTKIHIWNVLDDFAWWVGLERLPEETNKALMDRTVNIFRMRPSSSIQGLKNVIKNTLLNYDNIDDEEIKFELPDENNMQLLNSEGQTLYDELSSFNRDIARTKKWDIDYWENSFAEFSYIHHAWDAEVSSYKDGVGYNNSLKVSTVKDLDTELGTAVNIYGYKKSEKKIEEYFRRADIKKELTLKLKKYDDIMNPLKVQYKITASTLGEIKYPNRDYVNLYVIKERKTNYPLEPMVVSSQGFDVIHRNTLLEGNRYRAEVLPDNEFLLEKCEVKNADASVALSLLREYDQFVFDKYGSIKNRDQKFYADSVYDFSSTINLKDSEEGFRIIDLGQNALFSFETEGASSKNPNLKLSLDYNVQPFSISGSSYYISGKGYTLEKAADKYILDAAENEVASLVIDFYGNYLEYSLPKAVASAVSVKVYIDDALDESLSYPVLNMNTSARSPEPICLDKYSHIRVEIIRLKGKPVVENILIKKYEIRVWADKEEIEQSAGGTFLLPEKALLNIDVEIVNYGRTDFEINSVIVGKKLTKANSTYITEEFTASKGQYLDTTSLGKVKLFNMTTGSYENYLPYAEYLNNAEEALDLYLDTSSFSSITYSSYEIRSTDNGLKFITVPSGKVVSELEIYGKYKKLVAKRSLAEILELNTGSVLKASKSLKSVIIDNTEAVELTSVLLLSKSANFVEVLLSDEDKANLETAFVASKSKNVEVIESSFAGTFFSLYIYPKDTVEYIAYNTQKVVQEVTGESFSGEDIRIINSFSPAIPKNVEVLYELKDAVLLENRDIRVTVDFLGNGITRKWAASKSDPIRIFVDLGEDKDKYLSSEEIELTEKFNISNAVKLEDIYLIDNREVELARYLITAPEYINVIYENVKTTEYRDDGGTLLYVEADGFNKLPHANILEINDILVGGRRLEQSEYELLGAPGFIFWKNEKLYGEPFTVTYTYKKPAYLTYKSIDMLYELASYNIDTYEMVNSREYRIEKAVDGEIIETDLDYFTTRPDKINVMCDNPCYTARIDNSAARAVIQIKKIADDNSLIINNGYYYLEGNEYWYFADRKEKAVSRVDGVGTSSAERFGDGLRVFKEAKNYLKNSKMERKVMNATATFNFTDGNINPGISLAEHYGACETLSLWHTYKMKLTPSKGYDGDAILFSPEGNTAYAYMDIMDMARDSVILKIWFSGRLSFSICEDILIEGQRLSKSIYIKEALKLPVKKDVAAIDITGLDFENHKYYLMVSGSGAIIEMLLKQPGLKEDIFEGSDDFSRTLTRFNLKIEEKAGSAETFKCDFTDLGMVFEGLEISKDITLKPGTNIDWGLTKLKTFDLESEITKTGASYRNGIVTFDADGTYIETNAIRLDYIKSIKTLYIKVNNYPTGSLKGFDIELLVSDSSGRDYLNIEKVNNTNLAAVTGNRLKEFIKIRIQAEEGREIESIEVFAAYKEEENMSPKVYSLDSGRAVTKIYDLGAEGSFRLKRVNCTSDREKSNVELYVRGVRYDSFDQVYTRWYELGEKHTFNDYRYFQFKVELSGKDESIRIESFEMEAV